jgi:polysaccharide deacetylase family protein (PEP-CTERM system associated)
MPPAPWFNPPPERVPPGVAHIFSVDVEEYFQVNAFDGLIAPGDWSRLPSRVEESVDHLLGLLAEHRATATFFTLGWIAKRHPLLIRRIVDAGHEIASHGWWHRRVPTLRASQFRHDVRSSKAVLEDITGAPVIGYRAPSFSIVPGCEWAFDVLVEEGYRYDSSLFPVRRRGYGYPGSPSTPHERRCAASTIVELPPATLGLWGARLPAAGGGYLRHLPLALIRGAVRQHARAGSPAMLYIHPWELDPGQPRLPVGAVTRLRHYRGLSSTAQRLTVLLREFRFTSAATYLARCPSLEPYPHPTVVATPAANASAPLATYPKT